MKKMQNWQENIPMTKDKFWEVIDNARAIAPGKHRGHSGHVDTVSMLHDYAVCTNDDYGLVLHFNNKNQ